MGNSFLCNSSTFPIAADLSVASEEVSRMIPKMTVSTCDSPLIDCNGKKVQVLGIGKVGVS